MSRLHCAKCDDCNKGYEFCECQLLSVGDVNKGLPVWKTIKDLSYYKELVQEVKRELESLEKYKPWIGNSDKDYYRGQHDALSWVLEDLLGEEE